MRYRLRLSSGKSKRLNRPTAPFGLDGLTPEPTLFTRHDVAHFVSTIAWTKGCPLPSILSVEEVDPEGTEVSYLEVRLIADIRVKDRDTGEPTTVTGGELLILPTSTLVVFQRTIQLLQRLWMHEFAESLLMDGIRILDPHK